MNRIVTVPERKAIEVARRQAAVAELVPLLRAYAAAHGGRFLLYGSAARGTMRYNSDADIIVDFPEESRGAAWDYAEAECARLRVPPDIPISRTWPGAVRRSSRIASRTCARERRAMVRDRG